MGKASAIRNAAERDHRALRRQVANLERLTGGILLPREKLSELLHSQRLLVAFVKREGRVRYSRKELEALAEGSSLKAKVDGDYTTLSFEAPAPVEEQPETLGSSDAASGADQQEDQTDV